MMDLNAFAKEVHENAVAHGWWEQPREKEEILSLIVSEWAEAFEEYRAGRPLVWHKCPYSGGMCERQDVHQGDFGCESCTPDKRKPEGIAVELIDGCIRILDYLACIAYPIHKGTAKFIRDAEGLLTEEKFSKVIYALNKNVVLAEEYEQNGCLVDAFVLAMRWVREQGLDPVAIMREKHEYNKTRSYKHGGKVC